MVIQITNQDLRNVKTLLKGHPLAGFLAMVTLNKAICVDKSLFAGVGADVRLDIGPKDGSLELDIQSIKIFGIDLAFAVRKRIMAALLAQLSLIPRATAAKVKGNILLKFQDFNVLTAGVQGDTAVLRLELPT